MLADDVTAPHVLSSRFCSPSPSFPSPRSLCPQPALYEAFGLTVIEAMTCGLPVFATCHGGPREVIKHGISGFHIDPYHGAKAASCMAQFFEECEAREGRWREVSEAALARIESR